MRSNAVKLAYFCTAFLVSAKVIHAAPIGHGEAVVRLLNLFAGRTDALAVANAGKLLNQGASPSAVLAADLHAPLPSLGGWNSPETTRSLARQLGEYVTEHSGEFASRLPTPASINEPLRLEAFFEGLLQPTLGSSSSAGYFQNDLVRLSSLLDDAWLEAAAACGASNIQHFLLAHRGDLPTLLRTYQESKDDTAVILLGETLASYSQAYQQIVPREFHPRTLALLLAGALGAPNSEPGENLTIITTATRWTQEHPGLIDILRDLRDPVSLSLLEVVLLGSKDREKSMQQLAAIHWVSPRTRARLAMELFEASSLSESEVLPLIRLLPSEILDGCLALLKSGKKSPGQQMKVEEWIAIELSSRSDGGKAAR